MQSSLRLIAVLCLFLPIISCSESKKGAVKATVNAAAPDIALNDPSGNKVSLRDYKGKVVLVEFFATWCSPCRQSAPIMQKVYERYKDRGFTVIAVAMDDERNASELVRGFARAYGTAYPILIDDGSAGRIFGVISIPTSFMIDRNGTIKSRHMGVAPDFEARLDKEILSLL